MKALNVLALLLATVMLITGSVTIGKSTLIHDAITEPVNSDTVPDSSLSTQSSTQSETTVNSTSDVPETTVLPETTPEETKPITTTSQTTTTPQTTAPIKLPPLMTFPDLSSKIDFDIKKITPSKISAAISTVSASNAFVYDLTNGKLLANKGKGTNIVPASVTKLYSALFALYAVPSDLVIVAKKDELSLIDKDSSVARIKANHKLTVDQLIKGMMLPSGNDAAYVLAGGVARYLSGNKNLKGQNAIDYFMANVNAYAKALGCTGTSFTVPDGCSSVSHYTSSHDLVIIGRECLKNPIISEYAGLVYETVTCASGHTMNWVNSNFLLDPNNAYYSPYVTGLKTGSLSKNYCVYISAEIGSVTYLIGVFGAKTKTGRYVDAHIIIDSILSELGITDTEKGDVTSSEADTSESHEETTSETSDTAENTTDTPSVTTDLNTPDISQSEIDKEQTSSPPETE